MGADNQESHQAICSVKECPSLSHHADKEEFDLLEEPVMNQCCPTVTRVKCKHEGQLFEVSAAR